jgi:hypothetical protein
MERVVFEIHYYVFFRVGGKEMPGLDQRCFRRRYSYYYCTFHYLYPN